MKITLKVEGSIETRHEKITLELEVPNNWKPDYNEFSKVKGGVRFLTEKLAQNFTPSPKLN